MAGTSCWPFREKRFVQHRGHAVAGGFHASHKDLSDTTASIISQSDADSTTSSESKHEESLLFANRFSGALIRPEKCRIIQGEKDDDDKEDDDYDDDNDDSEAESRTWFGRAKRCRCTKSSVSRSQSHGCTRTMSNTVWTLIQYSVGAVRMKFYVAPTNYFILIQEEGIPWIYFRKFFAIWMNTWVDPVAIIFHLLPNMYSLSELTRPGKKFNNGIDLILRTIINKRFQRIHILSITTQF